MKKFVLSFIFMLFLIVLGNTNVFANEKPVLPAINDVVSSNEKWAYIDNRLYVIPEGNYMYYTNHFYVQPNNLRELYTDSNWIYHMCVVWNVGDVPFRVYRIVDDEWVADNYKNYISYPNCSVGVYVDRVKNHSDFNFQASNFDITTPPQNFGGKYQSGYNQIIFSSNVENWSVSFRPYDDLVVDTYITDVSGLPNIVNNIIIYILPFCLVFFGIILLIILIRRVINKFI